ncbi:MAG: hypothetical protein R8K47_06460 [Mariprofundaceae bacterium]
MRRWLAALTVLLGATGVFAPSAAVCAVETPPPEAVIGQFAPDDDLGPRRIETKRKHEILFWMGIALLVLLFATGALGVAMVAFGKDVFIAHMILAGLSLTLAVAHAATSIAWFWPF